MADLRIASPGVTVGRTGLQPVLEAEITPIHRMTPGVEQFQLRRLDGGTFAHERGQHTQLHVEDG